MCGKASLTVAVLSVTKGLRPLLGRSPQLFFRRVTEGQRPSAHRAAEPRFQNGRLIANSAVQDFNKAADLSQKSSRVQHFVKVLARINKVFFVVEKLEEEYVTEILMVTNDEHMQDLNELNFLFCLG